MLADDLILGNCSRFNNSLNIIVTIKLKDDVNRQSIDDLELVSIRIWVYGYYLLSFQS